MIALAILTPMSFGAAQAATATIVIPTTLSLSEQQALSTQGDGAGYEIGLNQSLGILFSEPIGVSTTNNVTIYTLPSSGGGTARARILFGNYNNGTPVIAAERTIVAGGSINIGNLFQSGCSVLGGCDYIEIITTQETRGGAGVEVDHVEVDGTVVEVTAPTPEPSTWALMILGFAGLALQLKRRRAALMRGPPIAAMSDRRSLPWRDSTAPETVHP